MIRSRTRWALVGVLLIPTAALTSCTKSGSSNPPPVTADQAERVTHAIAVGREIHRRDMLAWWATDAVTPLFGPEDTERFRGWVLDADDPSAVHFVVEIDGAPHTRWLARCEASGPASCEVETLSSPTPLSERNLAQRQAITTASEHSGFVPTSDRYNHVVMPDGSGWTVYLIAATVDPSVAMLGVHYRFSVSADATQVLDWRAFSKGPMVSNLDPPDGATLSAVMISHVLDDIPTEMHVWAALNYRISLAVRSNVGTIWMVDPTGNVTLVE